MFENPGKSAIDAFLRRIRTIAILGLSETPGRPSYNVAKALQKFGYRIVPVHPGTKEILGAPAWPDLESAIKGAGPIDVVDVFRRPEHVAAIVDDCIRLRVPALWLQEGVVDEAAAQKARDAGIFTVMDRCMFRDRSTLE
ncbi:MAG TPA: CoA-binding protein [Steroidobacteraceae bacterium]|jgi:predicted CoA-binding protein|nr:CoA-binding protein [Steroidobacteraceae bacterium]